jgi:2-deoxy-D-gluconate 3-dehydrogenase
VTLPVEAGAILCFARAVTLETADERPARLVAMSSEPSFSLSGQVVAVTGAGRGIGRAIALAAHRAGAEAVVVGSRSPDELKTLADEIDEAGGTCHAEHLDVESVESCQRFTDATIERFGRIDALVNNAGDNIAADAFDYDEAQFDHLVAVNFKGTFFLSQQVAKAMRDTGNGRGGAIVNVTSQAGLVGAPGRAPYSGAKAAVNNLTRTLAAEWAPLGLRVNAVAPTFTRTALAESVLAASPALRKEVEAKILLGRPAEPSEIAAPVVFLLTSAAAMITGHTLVVDGGWTIV